MKKRLKDERYSQSLPKPRFQQFTIIAQDPGVCVSIPGESKPHILTAQISIPAEMLEAGPRGYRVQVIDYDASSDKLWKSARYKYKDDIVIDPFKNASDEELLRNPQFHQQNAYAIIMRILARFEFALGRRVSWSFGGHQLKVAPHAFADANAFYSKDDESLLFGYFVVPSGIEKKSNAGHRIIFTCLSHDVVAHEATHALVDGLRERFTDPSSPDQAGFHEGISDVVALLSVFSMPEVVEALLHRAVQDSGEKISPKLHPYSPEWLRITALFALAEEMGTALNRVRGSALRRSARILPNTHWKKKKEFEEPHRRGEILVAMMLNAFIHIWSARVLPFINSEGVRTDRIVEEGRLAADTLMTMAIRALDYCPPVHLEFGDYLSALLTADREIRPDDSVYNFRKHLLQSFRAYGIEPTGAGTKNEVGVWEEPEVEAGHALDYSRTHFEPMQYEPDEVFRFIWENRTHLGLSPDAYTAVQSVRPCRRIGDDGFVLRETVAEYVQILRVSPKELRKFGVKSIDLGFFPEESEVHFYGGGTLIFDERGRLKYHVHNRLLEPSGKLTAKQAQRLKFLAETGHYLQRKPHKRASKPSAFGQLHLNRSLNRSDNSLENWSMGFESVPSRKVSLGHTHDTEDHDNAS